MWSDDDEEPMVRACGVVHGGLDPRLPCGIWDPRIVVSDGVHDGPRRVGIVPLRVKGGKVQPFLSRSILLPA